MHVRRYLQMLTALFLLLLLCFASPVVGQDILLDNTLSDQSENVEFVSTLAETKFDLNRMEEASLLSIACLSTDDIQGLLRHKKIFGEWRCMEELQSCSFLRSGQLDTLRLLCTVANEYFPLTKAMHQWQIAFSTRLQHMDTAVRPYSLLALSARTQFKLHLGEQLNLTIGLERDAAEPWLYRKSLHPVDYGTFTLCGINKSASLRYYLGDLEVLFGYGLSLYQAFMLSGRLSWNGIQGASQMFKAHQGMRENGYCEGIAMEWNRNRLCLGAFVSYRRLDNGSLSNQLTFSQAFQSSGLHTTNRLQAARQSVPFGQAGLEAKWNFATSSILAYGLAHVFPEHVLLSSDHRLLLPAKTILVQAGLCGAFQFKKAYVQTELVADNFSNLKYNLKLIYPFFSGDLYISWDDASRQYESRAPSTSFVVDGSRALLVNWQSPTFLRASKVSIGLFMEKEHLLQPMAYDAINRFNIRLERALSKKQSVVLSWQERYDLGTWIDKGNNFPARENRCRRVLGFSAKSDEVGFGTFSFQLHVSLSENNMPTGVLSSCSQRFRSAYLPGNWQIDLLAFQIKSYDNRMYILRQEWPGSFLNTSYSGDGMQGQVSCKIAVNRNCDFIIFLGRKRFLSSLDKSMSYLMLSFQFSG